MRWSAISVPPEEPRSDGRQSKQKKASKDVPEMPLAKTDTTASGPETAAGALDRIEMPEEARRRISELLWTGASLIVSDHARSYEMSEYSDFIVLTQRAAATGLCGPPARGRAALRLPGYPL